jgi:protein-S-isoprenylcysteine O-methyltransferase Ste14
MDGLIAGLSAKEISGVVFAVSVVFTVCSLELLRHRMERGPGGKARPATNATGAALGLVFLAMAGFGIAVTIIAGRVTFLSLGLFLTGAAGLGILLDLMIRARSGGAQEMRRIVARDL